MLLRYGAFQEKDMATNRIVSCLAYVFFFIPLVVAPGSKYARFHANQSFVLFAFFVFTVLTFRFVPTYGGLIVTILTVLCAALSVFGFVSAVTLHPRPLPLIGRIVILPATQKPDIL